MIIACIGFVICLGFIIYCVVSDNSYKTYRFDNYKVILTPSSFLHDVEAKIYKKHHLFATYNFYYDYEDFATPAEMANNAVERAIQADANKRDFNTKEKEFWGK